MRILLKKSGILASVLFTSSAVYLFANNLSQAGTRPPIVATSTNESDVSARSTSGLDIKNAVDQVNDKEVIAIINGHKVTREDLNALVGNLDQNIMRLSPEKRLVAALRDYVNTLAFAKGAEQDGLDKTQDFTKMMSLAKSEVLQKLFINKEIMDKITEDDIKKRYEKEISVLPREQEVHARHIIVRTKAEAEAIIKRLDAGEDFSKIAKTSSTDGSSAVGGDLGYFSKGQMVEPFEKAAFSLKVGTYTHTPVQTPFGWHIIKVEDKRMKKLPSLEDMHDALRNLIAVDRYSELLKKLRSKIDIKIPNKDIAKQLAEWDKTADNPDDDGVDD